MFIFDLNALSGAGLMMQNIGKTSAPQGLTHRGVLRISKLKVCRVFIFGFCVYDDYLNLP